MMNTSSTCSPVELCSALRFCSTVLLSCQTACEQCPEGSYAGQAAVACEDCQAGQADIDNNPATLVSPPSVPVWLLPLDLRPCNTKTRAHVNVLQCGACSPGQDSRNVDNLPLVPFIRCTACAAGFTDLDSDPATTCTECPSGKFSASQAVGPCTMCLEGQFSASGAAECDTCGSGQSDHDGNPATECALTDCIKRPVRLFICSAAPTSRSPDHTCIRSQ
jgi:hypothetical protein